MLRRALVVGYVALLVALGAHHASLWSRGLPVETDLLALLPGQTADALEEAAVARLAASGGTRLVAVVRAGGVEGARAAAMAYTARLGTSVTVQEPADVSAEGLARTLAPFRSGLMTLADERWLSAASDEAILARALVQLNSPLAASASPWVEDPLGLATGVLAARAAGRRVSRGSRFLETADGAVVLMLSSRRPAFSLDGTRVLHAELEAARLAAVAATPGASVDVAGVPLFAEAAASSASAEMSTVGLGSLLAILAVMALAFASLRPLVLVGLSVVLGVAAGVSAVVLVFGQIHVVTLVFGAGLVGVAEDFGIHHFASRQAQPAVPSAAVLRQREARQQLALVTSVAGYAMLAVAPFPGLRQVAVFSISGLVMAFATVAVAFPAVDRGTVRQTALASTWARTRQRWPTVRGRGRWAALALLAVAALTAARAPARDDVRALQRLPPDLVASQRAVAEAVGLPSPAQLFLVRGRTEAEVLEREEALTARLDALVAEGALAGHEAVSSWIPAPLTQARHRTLWRRARDVVNAGLAAELEAPLPAPPERPLAVDDALATPLGELVGPLWLGRVGAEVGSIVALRGLAVTTVDRVAEAAAGLEGVRFVDRPREVSRVLQRHRQLLTLLLAPGYLAVLLALWWRYRARAWRALAPAALASVTAVAVACTLGAQGYHVFHAFALWLLLGMGVDYGIFLVEHPSRQDGSAWLAVGLGAVSTLLSFGLLALSSTPAIAAFGSIMAVGIATVWVLAPVFSDTGQGARLSPPRSNPLPP